MLDGHLVGLRQVEEGPGGAHHAVDEFGRHAMTGEVEETVFVGRFTQLGPERLGFGLASVEAGQVEDGQGEVGGRWR